MFKNFTWKKTVTSSNGVPGSLGETFDKAMDSVDSAMDEVGKCMDSISVGMDDLMGNCETAESFEVWGDTKAEAIKAANQVSVKGYKLLEVVEEKGLWKAVLEKKH